MNRRDPGPGARSQPIVLLSAVGWSGVRGSERQLAEALARRGADVLWVDPPVSLATPSRYLGVERQRSWRPVLRTPMAGVSRFTPVAPPGWTRPGLRRLTPFLIRCQVSRLLRRTGSVPAALISCQPRPVPPGWYPQAVRVLYGTDDWVAGARLMRTDARRVQEAERRTLSGSDVVLAISPELAARWCGLGPEPVLFPNGCDAPAYAEVPPPGYEAPPAGLPAPVAGLVGQLNDRIDIELLEAVADSGLGLLLVGPRQPDWEPRRAAALLARDNVLHTGAVPPDDLARWHARIDVGLTPYHLTAFNQASYPLKTLEYLAAGRPVVSTGLPASTRLRGETPDVRIADGPCDFVAAVRAAAASADDAAAIARRRAVAGRHSWSDRAAGLVGLIAAAQERHERVRGSKSVRGWSTSRTEEASQQ